MLPNLQALWVVHMNAHPHTHSLKHVCYSIVVESSFMGHFFIPVSFVGSEWRSLEVPAEGPGEHFNILSSVTYSLKDTLDLGSSNKSHFYVK